MVIAAAIVSNVAQHGRRFAALLIIVATAFNLLTYTSFGLPDAVNALATRRSLSGGSSRTETSIPNTAILLTALRDRMTPRTASISPARIGTLRWRQRSRRSISSRPSTTMSRSRRAAGQNTW
jgi:hypothetical protein